MTLVGYARVSTLDQNPEMQEDALRDAGCSKIFLDKISGASKDRPGLESCFDYLRAGDCLLIWRLDRLARSLSHLLEIIDSLKMLDVHFRSLNEGIDTSSANGRLIFQIFGALAEFERNLLIERTRAGLKSARARGRVGGRPKALTQAQVEKGRALYSGTSLSIGEICEELGISRSSFYNYFKDRNT